MILEGTHDEINYFMLQCQKRKTCKNCVLDMWCNNPNTVNSNLVIKRTNSKYQKIRHGIYAALITKDGDSLITKGGSRNK